MNNPWIAGFLALAALSVSGAPVRASNEQGGEFGGWIVYRAPSTTPRYGKIPGLARKVRSAWKRADFPRIVDAIDEGGYPVSFEFWRESLASAFLAKLRTGNSYSVTDCAEPGARVSESSDGYCTAYLHEPRFYCGLADHESEIDSTAVTPEDYKQANPREDGMLMTEPGPCRNVGIGY